MIDIHSHIIHGIDDGAKSLTDSLEMLKIASMSGTKKIFATPHYYKGYFEVDYEEVVRLTEELNRNSQIKGIDIEVLPGQEVYLDSSTLTDYKSGKIGTLNNTKYMLVEFPMDKLPKFALDIIYELKILGITPIIAHPERYKYIKEKPSKINDFINEGCLFQINSGSIIGMFGKEVLKTANLLMENRVCHFIASDAHTTNRRRPDIKESIQYLEKSKLDLLTSIKGNMDSLILNGDIYTNSIIIKEKRSIFDIFK